MIAKVFLSLSHIDRNFVTQVRSRLPGGLAYFYERGFDSGENLIEAMERVVRDSAIFVLFASRPATASPWVRFEIDQARLQHIQQLRHRILVFPTDPDVRLSDLPEWLRSHWIARAGWTPSDIARYITAVLLDPATGLPVAKVRVIGRGKTLDRLEQLTADHMRRTGSTPNVFFLSGVRGIGRRTFASHYMRHALSAEANLPYGPTLPLSPQADLVDLYQALRTEIAPLATKETALRDRGAFQSLALGEQVKEIVRVMCHFSELGQAISIISAGGFFEDSGDPKDWVLPLLNAIPKTVTLFIVSNRQIPPALLQDSTTILQMRVEELNDKDIRALMIFTAERLGVQNFSVSDDLVRAIGGHADIANAAVRLAAIKGSHLLERDPRQLFNIQNTILGENLEGDALTPVQKKSYVC